MTVISRARTLAWPVAKPLLRWKADFNCSYSLHHTAIFREYLSPDLVGHFSGIMKRPGPLLVGRIGGSDYELVARHFHDPHCFASEAAYAKAVERVMQFNGYFDLENRQDNFSKFLDDNVGYYKRADCLTYGGARLIRRFARNAFKQPEGKFLEYICAGKDLIQYSFIEALIPFLQSFQDWGQEKTILIVSPFSRSLELQYRRRNHLIKGYRFPDFQLATCSSPITYSTPTDSKATLRVVTGNWHEECQVMASRIAEIQFDIALLSCASYTMFLGDFIRSTLGKKAIYLGGMLNPMFNIYGRRYDTAFFNDLMNLEWQIDALENPDVEHLVGGRGVPSEALEAYFGIRPPELRRAREQGGYRQRQGL